MDWTDRTNFVCCKCRGRGDLWAHDGEKWLCWDCADKHKLDTASTPSRGSFADIK